VTLLKFDFPYFEVYPKPDKIRCEAGKREPVTTQRPDSIDFADIFPVVRQELLLENARAVAGERQRIWSATFLLR
jgi:hypothetical protein